MTAKTVICTSPDCKSKQKEFQPPIYDTPLITIDEARRFMKDCLIAAGAGESHAQQQADLLACADHRGIFSHGMNRLDMYIDQLCNQQCDGKAMPQIKKETPSTAWVDGMNTLGAVVGNFCMDLAIKKAKETGVGVVSACNSNHYGIAYWYANQAYEAGLIGLSMTNTSPLMAPTRAKKATLGTNPISLVAPSTDDFCVIDVATTAVAVGKLEIQKRKGAPYPVGWAQDLNGKPYTDSESTEPYALLPLGGMAHQSGHKGYCLSLMVEILCGILSGANFGPFVPPFRDQVAQKNLGQFFLAIDPTCFCPGFTDRLDTLMKHLRNMDPIDPARPVLVPGDPEKKFVENVDKMGGIHYLPNQMDTCRKLAAKLNVEPLQGISK